MTRRQTGPVYTLTLTGPGENHAQSGDLDVTSVVGITGAGPAVTIIDGGSVDYPLIISRFIEEVESCGRSSGGSSRGCCRRGGSPCPLHAAAPR